MIVKLFDLETIIPTETPDHTAICDLDGMQKIVRLISTPSVLGVVIDNIYLSLAAGGNTIVRGDYALVKGDDGKIRLGINENLY
jgi:hypothetical protein